MAKSLHDVTWVGIYVHTDTRSRSVLLPFRGVNSLDATQLEAHPWPLDLHKMCKSYRFGEANVNDFERYGVEKRARVSGTSMGSCGSHETALGLCR